MTLSRLAASLAGFRVSAALRFNYIEAVSTQRSEPQLLCNSWLMLSACSNPSCVPVSQVQALWQTDGLVSVALACSMR